MRNKILGMFMGGAIGDALGLPVEGWNKEKIFEVHGKIIEYIFAEGHKYYTSNPNNKNSNKSYITLGSTSDDTQLTLAVLQAIITSQVKPTEYLNFDPCMDEIAQAHVKAMRQSTVGWGRTTLEAVQKLGNGVHWRESGKTQTKGRGTGNGVIMKCSPLAAWYAACNTQDSEGYKIPFSAIMVDFAAMTHYTKMAAESGLMHNIGLYNLIFRDLKKFNSKSFIHALFDIYDWQENTEENHLHWCHSHLDSTKDDIWNSMGLLRRLVFLKNMQEVSVDELLNLFGNASPYVYNSMPFSYAMFLRSPHSVQPILDTVNAGGDTDTNAKLVGELIGALNGIEIFEDKSNRWMIDDLTCADEIYKISKEFCDIFSIN